jgi:hypothetical protein
MAAAVPRLQVHMICLTRNCSRPKLRWIFKRVVTCQSSKDPTVVVQMMGKGIEFAVAILAFVISSLARYS